MTRRRKLIFGGTLLAAIVALGIGQAVLEARTAAQMVEAPKFEVDPFWPKPLPNGWLLGTVIGVGVDANDHIFIIHRGVTGAETNAAQDPPIAECCSSAPPVLEFDQEGNLVNSWGYEAGYEGPGFTWPGSNHGITVDHMNNIWIGGNGGNDSMVLKFTHDGEFIAQYGGVIPGVDSNATDRFAGVADIAIDAAANEAYIADGYRNVRAAVIDIETGEMKRFWGAYGNVPDDDYVFTDSRTAGTGWSADAMPQQQFRGPVHCAEPTLDDRVYVCDRQNNRVQEFTKAGEFIREAFYNPDTLGDGATWDISFSPDPEQRFMYIVDGKNARVHIVERETMEAVSSIGSGGRYPGQFQAAHSIISDSQGNIYVTETYEGRRIHKFVYQGIQQVPRHQGPGWPTSAP